MHEATTRLTSLRLGIDATAAAPAVRPPPGPARTARRIRVTRAGTPGPGESVHGLGPLPLPPGPLPAVPRRVTSLQLESHGVTSLQWLGWSHSEARACSGSALANGPP